MKIRHTLLLAAMAFGYTTPYLLAQGDLLQAAEEDISEDGFELPEVPELPKPDGPGDANVPEIGDNPDELPEIGAPPAAPDAEADPADGGTTFGPLEEQKREMEETSEGYLIKDAGLNDIFQFLAKSAGRQYFHNLKINGPDYVVTGHLDDGDPLNQMEELAFMYGLSLHSKGNTIYALTQAQLGQLPSQEFHYSLKYLRPTDIEQIKTLIRAVLSPGTGIVEFEPKTNTIVIIDTATRIEAAKSLLQNIDKVKGQIIVETKILRINSSVAERTGINWSNSLGNGIGTDLAADLGSLFGISTAAFGDNANTPGGASNNLVLSPIQLSGVLKFLNDGGISNQVSNPTLITEDNEQATISIIDRIPIITSTTTPGGNNGTTTVTEEVRYKIDSSDKAITEDPDNHREIGISIAVTPTLLPDGTVRMKMRPRSAQITGSVTGVGVGGLPGNEYPRVTESMVETIARIPDGNSLVVGGFYGEVKSDDKTKVPFLGDIPVINFFFKSKEASKEQTSLVFIVTPTSYDPSSRRASERASSKMNAGTELPCDFDSVDPYNPGPAHKPNMARTIRGMQPTEAPYYPREDEYLKTKRTKSKFSQARRRR